MSDPKLAPLFESGFKKVEDDKLDPSSHILVLYAYSEKPWWKLFAETEIEKKWEEGHKLPCNCHETHCLLDGLASLRQNRGKGELGIALFEEDITHFFTIEI